jgi:putative peptidoglycan lipid II flippase
MSDKNSLFKTASWISIATMLSRILGFVRDSINASLFGAGPVSDAYFVAFRIPNLLRDLLAEGALSSAFIPAFTKARAQKGDGEAWRISALMLNALIFILALLVIIGELFAPYLVALLAPGFKSRPDQFQLTILLTRWLFPFIAFMAMGALFMGMHNARKRFLLPALAPATMNAVMILTGLGICPLFGNDPKNQIIGWALGSLAGGLLQFIVQVPDAFKQGFRILLKWPFKDPAILKILGLMLPAAFALSITHINQVINTMFASGLAPGTVSYLYYGQRLMHLPLGVFGVAIATAALPSIALHHAQGDHRLLGQTLRSALRMSLFITLPAMAGLIALSGPINSLLFQWGRFSPQDAQAVAWASMAYSLGIASASWVKVLTPCFYVFEDSKTPLWVGIGMVLLNLGLNASFMAWLPADKRFLGLALSSSLVTLANAGLLLRLLSKKTGSLQLSDLFKETLRLLAGAAAMGAFVLVLDKTLPMTNSRSLLALKVLAEVMLGGLFWALICRFMGYDPFVWFKRKKAVSTPENVNEAL